VGSLGNTFGVPDLALTTSVRAPRLDWPVLVWGSVARSTRAATWSFSPASAPFNKAY